MSNIVKSIWVLPRLPLSTIVLREKRMLQNGDSSRRSYPTRYAAARNIRSMKQQWKSVYSDFLRNASKSNVGRKGDSIMARVTKKTSGGGAFPVVVSTVGATILGVVFGPLVGLISLPILFGCSKKDMKNVLEEEFPEEERDRVASECFRQGKRDVTVSGTKWPGGVL